MCILHVTQYVFVQDEIGDTALINACQGGHIETARVLLDHGANVDYQNKVFGFYFYVFSFSNYCVV
jgi:ankyrin repeat protein